jgi:hypothetical protein
VPTKHRPPCEATSFRVRNLCRPFANEPAEMRGHLCTSGQSLRSRAASQFGIRIVSNDRSQSTPRQESRTNLVRPLEIAKVTRRRPVGVREPGGKARRAPDVCARPRRRSGLTDQRRCLTLSKVVAQSVSPDCAAFRPRAPSSASLCLPVQASRPDEPCRGQPQ